MSEFESLEDFLDSVRGDFDTKTLVCTPIVERKYIDDLIEDLQNLGIGCYGDEEVVNFYVQAKYEELDNDWEDYLELFEEAADTEEGIIKLAKEFADKFATYKVTVEYSATEKASDFEDVITEYAYLGVLYYYDSGVF